MSDPLDQASRILDDHDPGTCWASWAKRWRFSQTRRRAPSSASKTSNSFHPKSAKAVASCGRGSIAEDRGRLIGAHCGSTAASSYPGSCCLPTAWKLHGRSLPASSWDLPPLQGEQCHPTSPPSSLSLFPPPYLYIFCSRTLQ